MSKFLFDHDHPYLKGNYKPMRFEGTAPFLEVEGDIPDDFCGVYYLNTSCPQFPPKSKKYHWFSGDGKVHAFFFRGNGVVDYASKWVRTRNFQMEREAQEALFGNKKLLQKGVLENPSILPDWESQAHCTFLSTVSDPSALLQHLKNEPLTFSTINNYPIKNVYQTTETLGNDRIAAVVAAAALFPAITILVIDAGSCITYDLLTEDGYQGGSISPGLKTFTGFVSAYPSPSFGCLG